MAYDSKWWGMRSGDLIGSGTITQEISDSIKRFFGKKDGKAGDIYLVIMALVAFGFGIAGYSLILTKYMPESKPVRIILDLIPMGIGCFLFYKAFFSKFDSKVYMESAAGLCIILMGYSLTFLSFDLSFIGGTKFMIWWMLFSIPVIYLATSTVGAIIYLYILISWLGIGQMLANPMALMRGFDADTMAYMMFSGKTGHAIFGWFFLLLILPHFMRYTDRPSYDTRKLVLSWFGGGLLIQAAISCFTGYGIIAGPFLMVIFYLAGKEYFADGKFWWNRPFQTLTILHFIFIAWALNSEMVQSMFLGLSGLGKGAVSINGWFAFIINIIVVLGVIAWSAYTIYNDYKGEKKGNIMLMAFPGVLVLCLLIDKASESSGSFAASAWIMSLYTLALGADYIMKGMKGKEYQLVALGIVIALPILIYRIIDTLKEALNAENWQIIIGLILLSVCAGLLSVGMNFYNSTRPNEE